MQTVAVPVPAALFAALYQKYGEETSAMVERCLQSLLDATGEEQDAQAESTPQYPRPGPGTVTGRVWEIAEQLERKTGRAARDAVVKACMSEGINVNTANTQYTHWRNATRR